MLRERKKLVGVLVALYLTSLPFTGFCYGRNTCWAGGGILLLGFAGLIDGVQVSWFANLLIILAWDSLLQRSKSSDRIAFGYCIGAFFVGNAFLFQGVDTSEAGLRLERVSFLGIGYWLWMGSITLSFSLAAHGVFGNSALSSSEERNSGALRRDD